MGEKKEQEKKKNPSSSGLYQVANVMHESYVIIFHKHTVAWLTCPYIHPKLHSRPNFLKIKDTHPASYLFIFLKKANP